jgi:hypothetical protein
MREFVKKMRYRKRSNELANERSRNRKHRPRLKKSADGRSRLNV